MLKLQRGRMQEIPEESRDVLILPAQFFRGPVESVPDYGMTERRHVHADLVSAPSIYFQLQQCELAECRINPLLNHVMGDRLAPLFTPGRHLGAMHAIAAYAAADGSLVTLHP